MILSAWSLLYHDAGDLGNVLDILSNRLRQAGIYLSMDTGEIPRAGLRLAGWQAAEDQGQDFIISERRLRLWLGDQWDRTCKLTMIGNASLCLIFLFQTHNPHCQVVTLISNQQRKTAKASLLKSLHPSIIHKQFVTSWLIHQPLLQPHLLLPEPPAHALQVVFILLGCHHHHHGSMSPPLTNYTKQHNTSNNLLLP